MPSCDGGILEIRSFELLYATTAGTDVVDVTGDVAEKVARSGIRRGHVLVFVPGATAAVTTVEYEAGAVADLIAAVERMAPAGIAYRHDARWNDGNGYAHVRAALLGPSVGIPVENGRLLLGTWQQIVVLDFDNRPRRRRVLVQVTGIA